MKKVYKKYMLHFRDLSSWNHKTLGISFSCTGANQSGKKGTVLKVVGTDHCSPLIPPDCFFTSFAICWSPFSCW